MTKLFLMRNILLLTIMGLLGLGCSNIKSDDNSYWHQQKDKFKYHNLKEFAIDSIIENEVKNKTLPLLDYRVLDNLSIKIPHLNVPYYLYSWQHRDSSTNEFTIIEDLDEHGIAIQYLIMDKKDSLLSITPIASFGSEAGIRGEVRSKFISNDTVLNIRSITCFYNQKRPHNKLDRPIGDSTFSYFIIHRDGKIVEKIFKDVKELHYDSVFE